jgi:hypothetical protein
MLNLTVAMSSKKWVLFFLLCTVFLVGAQTPPQEQPQLLTPSAGGAVQGTFTITGTTDLPDFKYAELSFSYAAASSKTWFLIQQIPTPVKSGPLAVWDTTTIADGIYQLRLQLFLANGQILETIVPGIRVRNYTPVETSTVSPQQSTATVIPIESPTAIPVTATPRDTPTRLPTNPVPVLVSSLNASLAWGVGAALLLFILFFIYQAVHSQEHRGS